MSRTASSWNAACFGDADLERLGRRWPRIAAQVNRNLNRVLASRVVSTAQALRS